MTVAPGFSVRRRFLVSAGIALGLLLGIAVAVRADRRSDAYVVKRFDTLWDLSGRFLGDPYNWERIWRVNAHIHDPDLIYPGDPLTIPGREAGGGEGEPAGSAEAAGVDFREAVQGLPTAGTPSMAMGVPEDKTDAAPAGGTIEADARALARRGRFGPDHLARIGFLWTRKDAKGLVAPGNAFIDDKESRTFQLFERLPVRVFGNHRYSPGDTVDVFDLVDYLRFEGEVANLVKRVGRARVEEVDGERVEATLFAAWDVVRGQDRIAPVERFSGRKIERVVDADEGVRGTVFTRIDNSEIPQPYQTFVIDRGERHGVRLGDIFHVRAAGATGGKPSLVGCALHVGEQSSTLAIVRLYADRLEPGDSVALAKRIVFREDR